VDWHLGKALAPPPKSVVLVADDGFKSTQIRLSEIQRAGYLFIYPSAISNADYAMTWDQLRALKKTGLFDVQSHSYWHPNFKRERIKLSRDEYLKFVDIQLKKSKQKLEKEVGGQIDMIAWPFGELPDQDLVVKAKAAGYVAAFTIVRRANPQIHMLLPSFSPLRQGKVFEAASTVTTPQAEAVREILLASLSAERRYPHHHLRLACRASPLGS
jgi:hypothetical protein